MFNTQLTLRNEIFQIYHFIIVLIFQRFEEIKQICQLHILIEIPVQ